mgnify:CR=1 FL=1
MVTPKELGASYDGNVLMSGDAAMSTGGTWYVNDFAKNAPGHRDEIFEDLMRKAMRIPRAPSTRQVMPC